jgi:mono/diheme cytochrome c family protein
VLTHRGELEYQLAIEADAAGELPDSSVADAIEAITEAWKSAETRTVHPLTPQPAFTADHVAAGRQAFRTKGCSQCHGEDGRGLTPDNLRGDLKDAWGNPIMAADLTSGMLHGGREPIDVYRRISTGINGTPMPGFRDALAGEAETLWNLASYVLYVSNRRRAGEVPEAGVATSTRPAGAATPAQGD